MVVVVGMSVFSLRSKILFIVLAFLSVIGMSFVLYSIFTTQNYKTLRMEGITRTIEFETEKVNKTITEIERAAVFFSIGAHMCFEAKSTKLGEDIAVEFLNSFPIPVGGGFWFAPYAYDKRILREGFYAFNDKERGGVRLDDTFFLDEYDYHHKSWYVEIAQRVTKPLEVVWTRPYYDDSGSYALMTTAGSCFFDNDGSLRAVSTVDWEINDVVANLTSIKPTPCSFVVLCDVENNYIISNTLAGNEAGGLVSDLPFSLDVGVPYMVSESSPDRETKVGRLSFDGVDYISFSRQLDNAWLLSVFLPSTEIFCEIEDRNELYTLLIAVVSLVMLFFAFLLISNFVNKPLKRLTEGVKRLGNGDLQTSIDIKSRDEMGLLASAFNSMTSQLRESIETNARVSAEKERIETELNVAQRIQIAMLPCIFPPFPDRAEFELFASMEAAREVGGDFYDFYLVDDDHLAVTIADVSGKGVPAALFMVISKTLLKNSVQSGLSVSEVFNIVNNMLCEHNEANMFVTAFLGVYEISSGIFKYVNAGHNPPLLCRKGGVFEKLVLRPGFVLAGMEDVKYRESQIALNKGDVLYLYTDGVTEAMNREECLFGEEELLSASNMYKDLEVKDFISAIKETVSSFAAEVEQADDITMLVLKITGGE